jgi:hypothetical protein
MRLTSTGLGIGTSSPDAKLTLKNPSVSGEQTVFDIHGATNTTKLFYTSVNQTTDVVNIGTGYGAPLAFVTNSTERMRINAGAPILCLAGGSTTATGTGIAFPATQNASSDANTLDDYEEGTWTPFWSPATTNFGSITYSGDTAGRYTKIGRLVYVQFFIQVSSYSGGSGYLRLQGFPFSTDGATNQQSGVTVHLAGSWGTNTPYSLDLGGTSANAKYRTSVNGTIDNGNLNVTDLATNCFVRATFCYQTST